MTPIGLKAGERAQWKPRKPIGLKTGEVLELTISCGRTGGDREALALSSRRSKSRKPKRPLLAFELSTDGASNWCQPVTGDSASPVTHRHPSPQRRGHPIPPKGHLFNAPKSGGVSENVSSAEAAAEE